MSKSICSSSWTPIQTPFQLFQYSISSQGARQIFVSRVSQWSVLKATWPKMDLIIISELNSVAGRMGEWGCHYTKEKLYALARILGNESWVRNYQISTLELLSEILNSTMHSFHSRVFFFFSFFLLFHIKAHSACVAPFCLCFPHVFKGFPIASMFLASPVSTLQILTNPLVFWLIVIDIVHRVFRCCALPENQKWQST